MQAAYSVVKVPTTFIILSQFTKYNDDFWGYQDQDFSSLIYSGLITQTGAHPASGLQPFMVCRDNFSSTNHIRQRRW
jgi:hypothetical protein